MRECDLKTELTSPIHIDDVKIWEHPDDGITFELQERHRLCENMRYISGYAWHLPKIMEHKKPKTVLITGLGLGLIPKYLEENYPDAIIDVVEINQNVIDASNQLGHLNKTNIIKGDMWMFAANKKYDLIIGDIWWGTETILETPNIVIKALRDKLSPVGNIYIPMIDYLVQ